MAQALSTPPGLIPGGRPLESITGREVGGEGWNLLQLRSIGFPVPDWCVLSIRVFDRALRYRHRRRLALTEISAAVILQRMVGSVASGVLFTREPEAGARRCVISAGPGLGEGVVISSRGILVEKGSVLSHTAITGRELGIPTVVAVKDATARIRVGDHFAIGGGTGEIRWV